jgi:glycosyltransferase involved in cell wall biosynthesis
VSAARLVSVVIPAYNQGEFLLEAIDSALSQTLSAVEVIVVDDGSTDDTPRIAASFGDRIVYLRQPNQGLAAARNTGIRAARAPLLQFLDSDDALYPDSLERACEAADLHPDASVFTTTWDEMDQAGRLVARVDAPLLPTDAFHALFDPMLVGPPCRYLVRRSAFSQAGLFDTRLEACEDWDMWLRIAATGSRFIAVPAARVRYRNYATSMSKNFPLMWRSGNRVLASAARVHRDCAECRRAQPRGVSSWREWCYLSMLAPAVRECLEGGSYYTAGRISLTALARDPNLAPYLLRSARTRARRSGARVRQTRR